MNNTIRFFAMLLWAKYYFDVLEVMRLLKYSIKKAGTNKLRLLYKFNFIYSSCEKSIAA